LSTSGLPTTPPTTSGADSRNATPPRTRPRQATPSRSARSEAGSSSVASSDGTVARARPGVSRVSVADRSSCRSRQPPTATRASAEGRVYASGTSTPRSYSRTQVAAASSRPPGHASTRRLGWMIDEAGTARAAAVDDRRGGTQRAGDGQVDGQGQVHVAGQPDRRDRDDDAGQRGRHL